MERDTPFETPWASNQPLNPRMCPPWWPGRHTTKIPRHSAQYSPDAETRTTHRPTSHGPGWAPAAAFCLRSSAATRTMISDTAVARSARNCAKKRRSHVFFLCDVLKSRGGGKTTSSSQHQVSRLAAGAADARLLRPARAGEGSLSTLTSE